MCTSFVGSLDMPAPDIEQRLAIAIVGRSPVARQLAFARERGWRNLKFYQTVGDDFGRDVHAADRRRRGRGGHVWRRDGDEVRLFWAAEGGAETADPGFDPHLAPDPTPLWTILDWTPGGRAARTGIRSSIIPPTANSRFNPEESSMSDNNRFLAVFLGDGTGARRREWEALPEDERRARGGAGMAGWKTWVENNQGTHRRRWAGPLGKTKRVSADGIADVSNAWAPSPSSRGLAGGRREAVRRPSPFHDLPRRGRGGHADPAHPWRLTLQHSGRPTMSRMIFMNLPVADLAKSKAFYEAIGFTNNPQFTDDGAACMVLTDAIYVMLLTHEKFAQFTSREIADAHKTAQMAARSVLRRPRRRRRDHRGGARHRRQLAHEAEDLRLHVQHRLLRSGRPWLGPVLHGHGRLRGDAAAIEPAPAPEPAGA